MKLLDFLIIAFILLALAAAWRYTRRKRKNGGCSGCGSCSGCSGGCGSCKFNSACSERDEH